MDKKWYLNTDRNRGGWIYAVVDVNDPSRVRYVGKTQVSIKEREAGHWYDANRPKPRTNSRMGNWLRKRERGDVLFREVAFCGTLRELDDLERRLIREFREIGQADLNIADGGEGAAGYKWTAEQRERRMETAPRGESHHNAKMTWEIVREIREIRSREYVSDRDLATRYGCHMSNIRQILLNRSWMDPDYDPDRRVPAPPREMKNGDNPRAVLTWEIVREIREVRMREWIAITELAGRYGISKSLVGNVLNNDTWVDPEYNPATLKQRSKK